MTKARKYLTVARRIALILGVLGPALVGSATPAGAYPTTNSYNFEIGGPDVVCAGESYNWTFFASNTNASGNEVVMGLTIYVEWGDGQASALQSPWTVTGRNLGNRIPPNPYLHNATAPHTYATSGIKTIAVRWNSNSADTPPLSFGQLNHVRQIAVIQCANELVIPALKKLQDQTMPGGNYSEVIKPVAIVETMVPKQTIAVNWKVLWGDDTSTTFQVPAGSGTADQVWEHTYTLDPGGVHAYVITLESTDATRRFQSRSEESFVGCIPVVTTTSYQARFSQTNACMVLDEVAQTTGNSPGNLWTTLHKWPSLPCVGESSSLFWNVAPRYLGTNWRGYYALVDWGDGTNTGWQYLYPWANGASHTYANAGTYTTVTYLHDYYAPLPSGNQMVSQSRSVTVGACSAATLTAAITVTKYREDDNPQGALVTVSAPARPSPYGVNLSWGDGTSEPSANVPANQAVVFTFTHVYPATGWVVLGNYQQYWEPMPVGNVVNTGYPPDPVNHIQTSSVPILHNCPTAA